MDYFKLKKLYNSKTKYAKIIKSMQKQPQRTKDQMLLDSITDGDMVLFEFLLSNGASPNAQNTNGETAVMYACHYNKPQMLSLLIESGAELGKTPKSAFSFLMDDANESFIKSLYGENLKFSDNVKIRHRCAGVNELMYACAGRFYGNTQEVVQQLINTKKVDINAKDAEGFSALLYAVESCNFDAAKVLIANGADVNIKDKFGNTPIMYALNRMYSKFMVKLLVVNGADLTVKNNFGENAEDMGKRNQERIGVKWLDQAKHFKEIYKGRPTGLKVTEEEPERA